MNHPLLTQAGIAPEDFNFNALSMLDAPSLSFQYTAAGELDRHWPADDQTALCDDAPARFKAEFLARWTPEADEAEANRRDPEACWARLQELAAAALAERPDSDRVQSEAWLAGVLPKMPAEVSRRLGLLHAKIAERMDAVDADAARIAEAAEAAAASGSPIEVRRWMTGCAKGRAECSFDVAIQTAQPDGSLKTTYSCCH